jgi:hypothetical protein
MSGGHYEYANFRLNDIAETIDNDIENNISMNWNMSDQTISRMKIISEMLHMVDKLAYFADYLYSGDSSEETFIKRFDEVYAANPRDIDNES